MPLIDALTGRNSGPVVDTTQRSRENSHALEMLNEAWQGIVSSAENMFGTAASHQLKYGHWNCIRAAKVVWSVPYINWCRIQFDSGGPDYPACVLTETAVQPFGIRNSSPLPPETMVLALWDPQAPYAIIMGCLPEIVGDGSRVHPGWISQGSNAGFKRERYYKDMPSMLGEDAGWIDWSDNRPIDGLAIGEWARLDDLGGGIFLDPLMKFLRVDESCGLWLYYMDRLTRLMGNNLDIISSVHEQIVRNDNGEGMNCSGSTPYYWEALGAMRASTDTHRAIDDEDVHFHKPYGKYEPKHDDQQAFYRLEEFRGYLGQAYMRHLSLPPYSPPEINRYSGEEVRLGVFREQLGLHGGWSVQSAHSISLVKRLLIPIAKRKLQPEDPTGDDLEVGADAYKFAGKFGDGPEHNIRGTPNTDAVTNLPHILSAAAMQDVAAYYFNWQGMHPFHYHLKDFQTPQQADLEPFTTLQYKPPFSELASKMWLDRPPSHTVPVDHRHDADYYETTAGLYITPEGGVVIRDGYGAEIRMGGGNIQTSAPGDIITQPGRSAITYAGDDVVIKANKSVDITSSQNDVRLKAERNMDLMSGNSGQGRMLLESKASGAEYDPEGKEGEDLTDPGILLKNAAGQVVVWAKDIYARTGGGDVAAGEIVLDANKGTQDIKLIARSLEAFLEVEASFALPVEESRVVHRLGVYLADFPTQLRAGGQFTVLDGGAIIGGGVSVIGGSVASDGSSGGLMGYLAPGSDGHEILTDFVSTAAVYSADQVEAAQAAMAELEANFWAEKKPGHDDVITQTGYAPRNDTQLNVAFFQLPSSYWQQLAAGDAPAAWTEPVISYQGQGMMPHPGRQKWAVDSTFLKPNFDLHDGSTGLDKPRSAAGNPYDDAKLSDWDTEVPDGNYPIIT